MGDSISDYDPRFPTIFREEAARLRAGIEEEFLAIEHVGSTAVPGLGGQPVIDLQIEAFAPLDTYDASVLELGYRKLGEGLFERRGEHVFRLSVVQLHSEPWRRSRTLRSFLRRHPDQVEWLSREKRSGAYAANKARILDACTARATEWDASTRAVFDAVYKGAGHLQFLSMHAGEALEILRRQAGTVGPLLAHAQLEALENADWRPHLVSCVAAFIQPPTPAVLAALWEAGPRSWVAPQIAATLSVVDSGFARGVKDLLDGIRDVPQKPPPPPPREYTPEELGQIAALFDPSKADPARQRQLRAQARAHSQRGPSWGLAPAAKWISALCGLADVDAATRARPDLVRLAEYAEAGDWGEFARRWRSAAQKAVG